MFHNILDKGEPPRADDGNTRVQALPTGLPLSYPPGVKPAAQGYLHQYQNEHGVWIIAPKNRPQRSFLEKDEQAAFVGWLRHNKIPHHSIPNSAASSAASGAEFKRQGLVAGAPDLLVLLPYNKLLAIEMKRECGKISDISPEQEVMLAIYATLPSSSVCVAFGRYAAMDFVRQAWDSPTTNS